MPERVLTAANQLTMLRMALAPVLVVLILQGEYTWAVVTFFVAGVTDGLDGLIARLGHQRTKLGEMLDPIADKLLMTACFVTLTWANGLLVRIPAWLTVIALSRDVIILVVVAVITVSHGRRTFPPSWLGKAATALQMGTAGVVLLLNALGSPQSWLGALFVATLAATVGSAGQYAYRTSEVIAEEAGE